MTKIDVLSPSFLAGLVGYAATDTGTGFLIGAAVAWLFLSLLFVVAAAIAVSERTASKQAHAAFAE